MAVSDFKSMSSLEEIDAMADVEYAMIEGFTKDKPFRIGSLSAGDLIEWSEANSEETTKRTAGLRLIAKSLVNDENVRYASADLDKSVAVLGRKSHKVTERIVKEILKLNGMTVKEEAATKKD